MSSRETAAKPVGRFYASIIIGDTLQKGGMDVTFNTHNRQIIVDGVDPTDKSALTYIVAKDGIAGPHPSRHEGNTKLDALVQNVAEDLSLVGLYFRKDNGRYEGDFSIF